MAPDRLSAGRFAHLTIFLTINACSGLRPLLWPQIGQVRSLCRYEHIMAAQLQPITVVAPLKPASGRRLFEAVAARGINREGVELAMDVGSILGLDAGQLRRLEFGALLHDVGKIEIPVEIINKEGQLSQEERAAIERHTIAGQEMLEGLGGEFSEVGLIVRSTHERFDGHGYPDGLAGEAIPIE